MFVFNTLAGTPPTNVRAGTSLLIKLPAAITAPSPIFTPFKIIALVPIHTLLPIHEHHYPKL